MIRAKVAGSEVTELGWLAVSFRRTCSTSPEGARSCRDECTVVPRASGLEHADISDGDSAVPIDLDLGTEIARRLVGCPEWQDTPGRPVITLIEFRAGMRPNRLRLLYQRRRILLNPGEQLRQSVRQARCGSLLGTPEAHIP